VPTGAAANAPITVEVTALDAFLPEVSAGASIIDVLKVDAEGADAWVLYGAETLLRAHRIRHVFFEYDETLNRRFGIKPREPQRFLQGCGYDVRRLGRFLWHAFTAWGTG
jgi:hypothetical protein